MKKLLTAVYIFLTLTVVLSVIQGVPESGSGVLMAFMLMTTITAVQASAYVISKRSSHPENSAWAILNCILIAIKTVTIGITVWMWLRFDLVELFSGAYFPDCDWGSFEEPVYRALIGLGFILFTSIALLLETAITLSAFQNKSEHTSLVFVYACMTLTVLSCCLLGGIGSSSAPAAWAFLLLLWGIFATITVIQGLLYAKVKSSSGGKHRLWKAGNILLSLAKAALAPLFLLFTPLGLGLIYLFNGVVSLPQTEGLSYLAVLLFIALTAAACFCELRATFRALKNK